MYSEHGIRADGTVVTLVVDSLDPATGITAFKPSSTVCADSTQGAEFDGISREDTGQLVPFHAAACDNGPADSGLDFFSFTVSIVDYNRSGFLTIGDIARSGP